MDCEFHMLFFCIFLFQSNLAVSQGQLVHVRLDYFLLRLVKGRPYFIHNESAL